MSIFQLTILTVVASFALSGPNLLYAQTSEEGDESEYGKAEAAEADGDSVTHPGRRSGRGPGTPAIGPGSTGPSSASPATTTSVVASLKSASAYCLLISGPYAIDCVAERLAAVAKELEGQEGFEEIQAVLEATSRDLNKIARQNRSPTLPAAAFTTKGEDPVTTTRRLVPVDDAALDVAVSQAIAVIVEAETLLLRSADESAERSIQFQQIAAAIGSNKVLLRSV